MRKKAGLNQTEFGKLLGVSQVSISTWETGREHPTWDMILKIMEVCKCDANTIFREDLKE